LQDITILGIQPIGLSLALSIKNSSIKTNNIVAYSENSDLVNSVKSLNLFDDVNKDLQKSLDGSSLVIIDSPLIEIPSLLESISNYPDIKTVLNLNGSQSKCMTWANDILDKSIGYVGIRPILKTEQPDITNISDLLLEDLDICLMPSTSTDKKSIENVIYIIEKIGANPYFLEVSEHDSYFTAMNKLSDVISAAYVNATTTKSSWIEMYKSAGIEFDQLSTNATKDPVTNEAECLTLSDPLIYWIEEMIASLNKFKDTLKSENDDLLNYFVHAWEQKAKWESGALSQNLDSPHMPSASEAMGNMILGGKLSKRLSGNDGPSKRKNWQYPK